MQDVSVPNGTSRRHLLASGLVASGLAVALPSAAQAAAAPTPASAGNGTHMVTAKDGTRIFFKDWGGRPTDRVLPRLAADRGCLGQPDVLSGKPRLPGDRS